MIKEISYKDVSVYVTTNFLKYGVCWFNEPVQGALEEIYRELTYGKVLGTNLTYEQLAIGVWDGLEAKGIKPFRVFCEDIIYTGTKMTDTEKQKTLKDEDN